MRRRAGSLALVASLCNDEQVTDKTPPTFLMHTDADKGVVPENSILFYLALRKAKVPAELHIYEKGPHGVGLAAKDAVLTTWKERLADWLALLLDVLVSVLERRLLNWHPRRSQDEGL